MSREKHVGLVDLSDYREIVSAIDETIEDDPNTIHKRLFAEAISVGSNVIEAAHKFGVQPHVYNKKMKEFYKETNAFIYELTVSHCRPSCHTIDRRVVKSAEEFCPEGNVLCLGDGIGSDTIRFAQLGYTPTYFEFEGPSARFAIYRFERSEMSRSVELVHELERIPNGKFDIVVCREVLEHVPNPVQVIRNIWSYLKDDGIAIITESFGRVGPRFPTHLRTNEKYQGKTEWMFVKEGFTLLESFEGRRPMVFRKVSNKSKNRYLSIGYKYAIKNYFKEKCNYC